MLILGIDPSINNTGLALYDSSKKVLIEMLTLNAYKALSYVEKHLGYIDKVRIEGVGGAVFRHHSKKNAMNKMSQRTGQPIAVQNIFEQMFKHHKFKYEVVPQDSRRRATVEKGKGKPTYRVSRLPKGDTPVGPQLLLLNMPTKTTNEQFEYLLKAHKVSWQSKDKRSPFGSVDARDAATMIIHL